MTDLEKVEMMEDMNWKPAAQYWKGQYDDLLDELFKILDTREETDEGRVHRPIKIVSTREHLRLRLERVLSELKATRGVSR